MSDIDPVQFGALTAQVSTLQTEVADLKHDVKTLVALANKSKGTLWALMGLASAIGAGVTLAVEWFKK